MRDDNREDERAIRERAFFIWLHEGRPNGQADNHWVCAVREEAREKQRQKCLSGDEARYSALQLFGNTTMTRKRRPTADQEATEAAKGGPDRAMRVAEAEERRGSGKLFEIREGLFINLDHIVSVKVVRKADDLRFAVLKLSNGEHQHITREEFAAIVGGQLE